MGSIPKRIHRQHIGIVILAVICLSIIGGTYRTFHTPQEQHLVDSLNNKAYQLRYTQQDSVLQLTQQSLLHTTDYNSGKAEALNHQLFQAGLNIDFKNGKAIYNQIQRITNNQVELLISDITMMMMCQRTGQHLSYFDYMASARRHIARIEEEDELEGRIAERYFYAINEYRLVNTLHMLQTATLQMAEQELDKITICEELRNDKTLWANYHYIKGLLYLNKGNSQPENVINAFDLLFQSFTVAERHQLTYFTASIEQVFSEMLTHPITDSLISHHRGNESHYLYNIFVHHDNIDESGKQHLHVAKEMAKNSIMKSQQFGNLILKTNGLLAMGDAYFYNHEPQEALSYYEQALECLNTHHQTFYSDSLSDQKLMAYDTTAQQPLDMQWVIDEKIQIIPATLLQIREALSRAYSAIGSKQASDYNRNIYLDVLSHTRENKYIESRINDTQQKNRFLSFILYMLPILMLSIIGILLYFTHKRNSKNKQLSELLDYLDRWFNEVYTTDHPDKLKHLKQAAIKLCKDKRVTADVILPYMNWRMEYMDEKERSETTITQLIEEFRKSEIQIEDHKRDNILKRAKVSLIHSIMPFIDRILYVARKLNNEQTNAKQRLTYISELADQIEVYNKVLSEWININKGKIDLTIEVFAVQEILDMIAKSGYGFERKGIQLQIQKTNAIVKADKALTFFMLNTLAENARKFTPTGGTVTISTDAKDNYVELVVTDNGVGLTDEELHMILTSKIYDAQEIGSSNECIRKEKGNGFGLLNCKGIIEKYKKEGDIFNICQFNIKSKKGEGSRFSFRLPKGTARILFMGWLVMNALLGTSTIHAADNTYNDSTKIYQAIASTDSVYYANINGDYNKAISFANKALTQLNSLYNYPITQAHPLSLHSSSNEEIEWWKSNVPADYHLILQIRNEIAVAALALCDWDMYEFNNHQYIAMNELVADDSSLMNDYNELVDEQQQIKIYITLAILLLFFILGYIYIAHTHKNISYRYHIMRVLEMNRLLLQAVKNDAEMNDILEILMEGLREIHEVRAVKLLIQKGNHVATYGTPNDESLFISDNILNEAYHENMPCFDQEKQIKVYPLSITNNERHECYGAIGLYYEQMPEQEEQLEWYIIKYLTLLLRATIVNKEITDTELTKVENERQRALFEENRLHVQNMILENCLSTIKHESMYYPGRIKQIAETLLSDDTNMVHDKLKTLVEVVEYYKYIYALFCKQADRQIETGLYRCSVIPTDTILTRWRNSLQKYAQRQNMYVQIECHSEPDIKVYAEPTLISFLLDTVSKDALLHLEQNEKDNSLTLTTEQEEQFIKFRLETSWNIDEEEATKDLFQAENGHYALLLCKEIIREHDKLNNFCGCRINIEKNNGGGNTLWFTIPKNDKLHESI